MLETIDSRQLLAFCTLVQTGSFTETARILSLTQSAISHSVKNLETDLRCQLVTRTGRKINITDDGEELYKDAQNILNQMQGARMRIQDRVNWGRGRLRIGASTTACQHILPNVLREFNECFPDCILTITPADTPQLLEMTRRHEIDLAIIVTPSDLKEIEAKPLFSDELILVTSPIHEFAQSGRARMAKIAQERMVLYNKGSHTFDLVEQAFRQNKLLMQNYIELGSMEAIKELVKINYGVSFLASWTVENEINAGSLMQISTGQRKLIRNWGISYAKDKKLSITEETFLGISQAVCSKMHSSKQTGSSKSTSKKPH
ncbi:LysR family transcriptional regulator [Coraliomargarita sp. SDUM461003]|uniref:LysR family transcriptional regulator n=1 Tax=Thalassobacterium maritimum TaxID=3041265 RepID=A0ABU1ATC8_9BACT|nr:LysR family transcriptional regulator [Coraliomargarita sp. SDUM461003]MDQ8207336.1 LysR family transcriptional regulator [Coraliomargarita sp. SDUM461003]